MEYYCQTGNYYQLGKSYHIVLRVEDTFKRFMQASRTNNLAELAEWLGAEVGCLSDAKLRNIIPVAWLHLLVKKQSPCHPWWVLTGQGHMHWQDYLYDS